MTEHREYPLIKDVQPRPGRKLLVRFRNGITKLYDCADILKLPAFESLRKDDALFRLAHADPHGYGVVWNDELDLAESEVWLAGTTVNEEPAIYSANADGTDSSEAADRSAPPADTSQAVRTVKGPAKRKKR